MKSEYQIGIKTFLKDRKENISEFGYTAIEVSCSNWTSPFWILYDKNVWEKKSSELIVSDYMGFKITNQNSDLRAVFNNEWDQESSRIFALYTCSKIFETFDWFDIGANYGLYSLPFINSKKAVKSIIVEPNPFLTTCLHETFSDTKAEIIEAAVCTTKESNTHFHIKPFISGASSIREVKKTHPLLSLCLKVKAINYRELISVNKISSCAVVKLDIEGYEINLLQDSFLEYLSETYDRFVLFIELIPSQLSAKELEVYTDILSQFYCLPLTNSNYKPNNKDIFSKESFFRSTKKVSEFYQIDCKKGIDWFINDPKFSYGDIIVFSNPEDSYSAIELFE